MGTGAIGARLYDAGAFPAAVPDSDARAAGDVFELERVRPLMRLLDRYEGRRPGGRGLFRREIVPVELEGGGTERAWAYFYERETDDLVEITSGDYLEYLEDH